MDMRRPVRIGGNPDLCGIDYGCRIEVRAPRAPRMQPTPPRRNRDEVAASLSQGRAHWRDRVATDGLTFASPILAAILTLLLLRPSWLSAQMNTADIVGVVSDPSGAAVPGASVVATNAATQMRATASSNEAGEYVLPELPPGEYSLTVTAAGFRQAVQMGIVLHAGDHLRQDFALRLGERRDVVV